MIEWLRAGRLPHAIRTSTVNLADRRVLHGAGQVESFLRPAFLWEAVDAFVLGNISDNFCQQSSAACRQASGPAPATQLALGGAGIDWALTAGTRLNFSVFSRTRRTPVFASTAVSNVMVDYEN